MQITKEIYNHNAIKDDYIYCTFRDLSDISNNFTSSININYLLQFLKDTKKLKDDSIVNIIFYDDLIQIMIDQTYTITIYNINEISFNKIKLILTKFEYNDIF